MLYSMLNDTANTSLSACLLVLLGFLSASVKYRLNTVSRVHRRHHPISQVIGIAETVTYLPIPSWPSLHSSYSSASSFHSSSGYPGC